MWVSVSEPRSEHVLALARGQDAELLAVLRDCPASDIDPGLLEELHDLLIAVRPLDVFAVDELLDLRLHGLRGQIVPVGSRDAAIEEELELEDALRGMDVLRGRHA